MGGTAISMKCDVTDEKSVNSMVDESVEQFGGVDVLVNNAAYFMTVKKRPFWEMKVEEFDKAMAVNVRGSWLCAKAAVPHMKQQGKGKIINISSGYRVERRPELHPLRYFQGRFDRHDPGDGPGTRRLQHLCQHGRPGFVVTEGRQVDPAFNASRVANRALRPGRERFGRHGSVPGFAGK